MLYCSSPISPEPAPSKPSGTPYTYGLYDDFENGKINRKWTYTYGYFEEEKKGIKIISEESGNSVLEIKGDRLNMLYPKGLYPHEFDRMSARVMLHESLHAQDFFTCLHYSIRIASQGGGMWEAEIGIGFNPQNNIHLFGRWTNYNTDEMFYTNLGSATFEKWYKLEIRLIKIASDTLKIEYAVNGVVLAESIPTDSSILLDPSQLYLSQSWRGLRAFGGTSGISGKGWFDDVYAVFGDRPENSGDVHSLLESSSLFHAINTPVKITRENNSRPTVGQEEKIRDRKDGKIKKPGPS